MPEEFLRSLEGVPGFDKKAFIDVHEAGERVVSIRFNKTKKWIGEVRYLSGKVPWSADGYYLSERPFFTFDPLIHAGVYYVQEASGMFLEQVLRQTIDLKKKIRVLDLCAAPGGKSTLIQSLISEESLLVSNEVIKSRVSLIEENLTKWGASNVVVTNNDSRDFRRINDFFDVIVVDAPCSGSGLFRKDKNAIGQWSEENVQLCSQRQQRILSDALPSLKEEGILVYSTCSYSPQENEEIADWLMKTYNLESVPLELDPDWKIVETRSTGSGTYGYRFYPDKVKGEGFFIACFRKTENSPEESTGTWKRSGVERIAKAERIQVENFIREDHRMLLWKLGDRILAFPEILESELQTLLNNLYIKKAGTAIGKSSAKDLIPDHELALSSLLSKKLVAISLNKDDALQYLRKEEVRIISAFRGWAVVEYEGVPLGWIKHLGSRINNYYPKEWRIIKSAGN